MNIPIYEISGKRVFIYSKELTKVSTHILYHNYYFINKGDVMRKTTLFLFLLLLCFSMMNAQVTTLWEKSSAQSNYPAWLGTGSTERGFAFGQLEQQPLSKNWEKSQGMSNYPTFLSTSSFERGFAYGKVGGNERVYVVSRDGGTFLWILDAATGDSVGALNTTGISGGAFPANDIEVSDDGLIFVANLTTNSTTSPFRVYKYDTEASAPVEVINYTGLDKRFGDKFSVSGSASDNSLTVWAVTATADKVVKFTTTDNGATFTPTEITLSDGAVGNTPSAFPNAAGTELYVNSNGFTPKRFLADGTFQDAVDAGLVSSGSNSIRYFTNGTDDYVVTYNYGSSAENLRVLKTTNGFAAAELISVSNSLGSVSNGNGVGDVDVRDNGDGTFTLFILATNNGLASYNFDPAAVGSLARIYVPSRLGGQHVLVVDAETGDSVKTLSIAGVSGGTFLLNDMEVSDDGIIFGANLTTNASTSPFRVYRWDNESAAPVEVIAYTDAAALRFGDKFTVTGSASDNSLTVWAVAATNAKVMKFTTADNGMTFTPSEVTLSDVASGNSPAVWANADASELYVNSNGFSPKRYLGDGTFQDVVSGTIVGTGSNALRVFETDTRKFLVTYNYGASNENLRIVDVTDGFAAASLVEATAGLGSVSNGNGVGDVDFVDNGDGTYNLYILATNNGLAAYKFTPPAQVADVAFDPAAGTFYGSVSVELSTATSGAKIYYTLDGTDPSDASTEYTAAIELTDSTLVKAIAYSDGMMASNITEAQYNVVPVIDVANLAELRSQTYGTNDVFRVTGEVYLTFQQSFRNQKWIQDSTAGVMIDDNSGILTTEYNVGDGITGLVGNVIEYGGMVELVPVASGPEASSTDNVVVPQVITLQDFKTNFEMYESELVTLENVTFIDGDGSSTYANGTVYPLTDGVDTVDFRTTFYNVDYIGELIFENVMNVTGIMNSRSTGDFISSRSLEDLGIAPFKPDTMLTYWTANVANNNLPDYFTSAGANYERGMAYGYVDGNHRVYVASRSGGPHIVIHDADNGAIVGEINARNLAVGLFPLNQVDVSDDGIIFGCNMTLNAQAGGEFTVYRWDNETADPKIVAQFDGGGRLGDMFSVTGSTADNSLVIFAGIKDTPEKAVKFTTTDNGQSFTWELVTFVDLQQGTNQNFQIADDGTVWSKSYGGYLIHYQADGAIIDTAGSDVVGTSASKIRYFKVDQPDMQMDVILAYYPDVAGNGLGEYVAAIDVTNGAAEAKVIAYTPQLGNKANGNGSGGVDYRWYNDSTLVVYALGTNNGIGAYSSSPLKPTIPLYAPQALAAQSVGTGVQLDWNISGGPGALVTMNSGAAISGFYQDVTKAYGSVFDLSGLSNPELLQIDFAHSAFDFFGGDAEYVVHVFDWDAQTKLFIDTLSTVIDINSSEQWETVNITGVSNVAKVGVFIQSITPDSFGDGWPTVLTDDIIPPKSGGQVIINDLADPFNNLQEPGNATLGHFLIDLWVNTASGKTPFRVEPVAINSNSESTSKVKSRTEIAANVPNPRRVQADFLTAFVKGYKVYRGTSIDALTQIGETGKEAMTYYDADLVDGTYFYGVTAVYDGEESPITTVQITHVGVGVEDDMLPAEFSLDQNYPNPFNPTTVIKFGLKVDSKVSLKIYNILGQEVATLINGTMNAGFQTVEFKASYLSSGVYLYRIEAVGADGSNYVDVKKMMLLK